jgi:hypothetical protein
LKYRLGIGMKGMLLPGFAVMFYCEHGLFTFHSNLLGGPKVHLTCNVFKTKRRTTESSRKREKEEVEGRHSLCLILCCYLESWLDADAVPGSLEDSDDCQVEEPKRIADADRVLL